MNLRSILFWTILPIVAWTLTPALTAAFAFIPIQELGQWVLQYALGLSLDEQGNPREPLFYAQVAIWTLVLYLIVRFLSAPLQGALTGIGLFSEQKVYRRGQYFTLLLSGIFAPTLVIYMLFFLWPWLAKHIVAVVIVVGSGGEAGFSRALQAGEILTSSAEIRAVIANDFIGSYWLGPLILGIGFVYLMHPVTVYFAPRIEALLRMLESRKFGRGGTARFSGLIEEINERLGDGGIFYGNSLYVPWLRLGAKDERHMLTLGGSRTGKGASCIIPNLLLWRGSALVVDPKGTAAYVTARRRREQGQKVILIDPFDIVGGEADAFNPLEGLNPNSLTIMEEIGQITEALIIPEADDKNRHFVDGAKALIAGYIAQAISDPEIENPTLLTISQMISESFGDPDDLHAKMSMNEGVGGIAQRTANRMLSALRSGSSEFESVRATAIEQTNWLTSLAMADTLSRTTFDFRELKKSPGATLYLVIPPQFLDIHKRFLRLFINLAMTKFPEGGKSKTPCLFVIDEAHSLGRMEEISRAYGANASYNMVVWAFFQDIGQLEKLYGAERTTFIANSRATQVFGVTDATAKHVSEELGTRALASTFVRSTESVELRSKNDVEQDISRESGRQYILRTGKKPLVLQRINYFETGWLKVHADADPDHPWDDRLYRRKQAIDKIGGNAEVSAAVILSFLFVVGLLGVVLFGVAKIGQLLSGFLGPWGYVPTMFFWVGVGIFGLPPASRELAQAIGSRVNSLRDKQDLVAQIIMICGGLILAVLFFWMISIVESGASAENAAVRDPSPAQDPSAQPSSPEVPEHGGVPILQRD